MSVDISDLTNTLCERFNLDPARVGHVELYPKLIRFHLYRLNENGSKYIAEDGRPAMEPPFEFEVST